jgi:hypothetical protein
MTTLANFNHAACGCRLVQCDPCGKLVPIGETIFIGYADSGAAQSDTTACAACRGADPADVHPTCSTCGTCGDCHCGDTPPSYAGRG